MDLDGDLTFVKVARGGAAPVAAALAKLRAGQHVSVLEYNTMLAAMAVVRDMTAQQKPLTDGTFYDSAEYHGPEKDWQGKRVQVVGEFLAPSGPEDAVKWYAAQSEAIDKLASAAKFYQSPTKFPIDGELWGLAGDAGDAAVDPGAYPDTTEVGFPREIGTQFADVFDGSRLLVTRLANPVNGQVAAASADEVRLAKTADTLAADRKKWTMWVLGGAGLLLLLAVVGIALSPSGRRVARATGRGAYRGARREIRRIGRERTTARRRARSERVRQTIGGGTLRELYRERMDLMRALKGLRAAERERPGRQHKTAIAAARRDLRAINGRIAGLNNRGRAAA
jgi:hypothetical protein